MNKENVRGAAGLRRSAIAERNRLKAEWSALKEVDIPERTTKNIIQKPAARRTPHASSRKKKETGASSKKKTEPKASTSEALTGVVALVDVGSEDRALPLRAVLTALGATVVREWSPLVTHLIWTDNGSRNIRARARALACKLVSPLWVEACAAAGKKLSEKLFPAAARHSDLPSPKKLRMLLKKAEREKVPLVSLLSESNDSEDKPQRLKYNTSSDDSTDKTADKTTDTSTDSIDVESRVNTASRGATTRTTTTTTRGTDKETLPPPKSRRKLFTCKEVEDLTNSEGEESDSNRKSKSKRKPTQNKMVSVEKRDLARAERMAKKLLAACNTQHNNNNKVISSTQGFRPRIVLTGMSRHERTAITKYIKELGGVVQNSINRKTTHVLLGACRTIRSAPCSNHSSNISGVSRYCDLSKSSCWVDATDPRARTLSALWGAAAGARVLHARWAVRSAERGYWLPHHDYVVQHLYKIAQKARIERVTLRQMNRDYAYNVFCGLRVLVTEESEQKEAAIQLLKVCGARLVHYERRNSSKIDVVVGREEGEVHSKWVFDCVAAARVRSTRKYISMNNVSNKGKRYYR